MSESDPAGPADEALFPGFRRERIRTREAEIHTVVGGHGPPVLLLHGYPETHACWHRVVPALAARFTVVCPDLRGYGDSSRPPSDLAHRAYSKRAMAEDQRQVMARLGFDVENDAADRGHRRIACPVLTLWEEDKRVKSDWDSVAIWRDWARDVRGQPVPSGHFLPEEAPAETLAALEPFLIH